jgi:probable rRNA maturation factor
MILNRQRRIRVPTEKLRRFLTRAQEQLHLPAGSLTVCLVSDAEIACWNRAYRRKTGPTDVLSFSADAKNRTPRTQGSRRTPRKAALRQKYRETPDLNSADPRKYLGDIAIAPAVARRNALRFGRTFEDELRILILHGMLHLMGYDHETDAGQMDRREQRERRLLGLA